MNRLILLLLVLAVVVSFFAGCTNLYTDDDLVAVLNVGPVTMEFSIPLQGIFARNNSGEGISLEVEKKVGGEFLPHYRAGLGGKAYHVYPDELKIGNRFCVRVYQGKNVWSADVVLCDNGGGDGTPRLLSSSDPAVTIDQVPFPECPSRECSR